MNIEFTRDEWRELLQEIELWETGDESGAIHIALIIQGKIYEK